MTFEWLVIIYTSVSIVTLVRLGAFIQNLHSDGKQNIAEAFIGFN